MLVENEMGHDPEDSYYIGDSYRNDVVGAKMAGWNAIWVIGESITYLRKWNIFLII